MRGIALSLVRQNNHVPVINDLLKSIIGQTGHVPVYLDKEWTAKVKHFTSPELRVAYLEHPLSEGELADHLDVPIDAVQTLRSEMCKVRLGAHLCVDPKFREVLDALALWDL
jgi:hypothetical protein